MLTAGKIIEVGDCQASRAWLPEGTIILGVAKFISIDVLI